MDRDRKKGTDQGTGRKDSFSPAKGPASREEAVSGAVPREDGGARDAEEAAARTPREEEGNTSKRIGYGKVPEARGEARVPARRKKDGAGEGVSKREVKKNKVAEGKTFQQFSQVSKLSNVWLSLLFILLALICVIPFFFVMIISISSEDSIARYGYRFWPRQFSTEAYEFLWMNRNVLVTATGVTLLVTVVGTVLGLFLTTSMGYVISRRNFKFRGFFTWVVFIPMIFNGGLISTYFINKTVFKLGDSIWALILPLLVSSFNVVVCKTFFKTSVPDSIIESGEIDGASQMRIFFRIVLPISLPLLATIALFLTFGYWNDWWQALLYINVPEKKPLQALLSSIERNTEYMLQNAGLLGMSRDELMKSMPKQSFRMAIAVVIILPIACVYPAFQRYFISGLTIGAVKG